jgi:hypothetical protein
MFALSYTTQAVVATLGALSLGKHGNGNGNV